MLDFKLYAISDRKLVPDIPEFVTQASKAGLRAFQLREKDLPGKSLFELASGIRSAASECQLFINDRADIAVSSGAWGIHLPENSWSPKRLKSSFSNLLVGASVHSARTAQEAEEGGADFLLFGPVFETPLKETKGLKALKEIVSAVKLPVFAVGGMTPERARQCIEQGAWGVAAIRDLLQASNISERLHEYKEVLGSL